MDRRQQTTDNRLKTSDMRQQTKDKQQYRIYIMNLASGIRKELHPARGLYPACGL